MPLPSLPLLLATLALAPARGAGQRVWWRPPLAAAYASRVGGAGGADAAWRWDTHGPAAGSYSYSKAEAGSGWENGWSWGSGSGSALAPSLGWGSDWGGDWGGDWGSRGWEGGCEGGYGGGVSDLGWGWGWGWEASGRGCLHGAHCCSAEHVAWRVAHVSPEGPMALRVGPHELDEHASHLIASQSWRPHPEAVLLQPLPGLRLPAARPFLCATLLPAAPRRPRHRHVLCLAVDPAAAPASRLPDDEEELAEAVAVAHELAHGAPRRRDSPWLSSEEVLEDDREQPAEELRRELEREREREQRERELEEENLEQLLQEPEREQREESPFQHVAPAQAAEAEAELEEEKEEREAAAQEYKEELSAERERCWEQPWAELTVELRRRAPLGALLLRPTRPINFPGDHPLLCFRLRRSPAPVTRVCVLAARPTAGSVSVSEPSAALESADRATEPAAAASPEVAPHSAPKVTNTKPSAAATAVPRPTSPDLEAILAAVAAATPRTGAGSYAGGGVAVAVASGDEVVVAESTPQKDEVKATAGSSVAPPKAAAAASAEGERENKSSRASAERESKSSRASAERKSHRANKSGYKMSYASSEYAMSVAKKKSSMASNSKRSETARSGSSGRGSRGRKRDSARPAAASAAPTSPPGAGAANGTEANGTAAASRRFQSLSMTLEMDGREMAHAEGSGKRVELGARVAQRISPEPGSGPSPASERPPRKRPPPYSKKKSRPAPPALPLG